MKKLAILAAAAIIALPSCSTLSQTANGGLIGSGAGAAIGAGIGYLIGGNAQGTAIGAAVGTAVGGATGAIIGNKMDKKAEELAALENAQVETITDVNGLTAIKVTFASGILFPLNGTSLSESSKNELKQFASQISDLQDTDLTIWGHTDNTGTAAVNEKISTQRAESVSKYLVSCGISKSRLHTEGKSFNLPVVENDTEENRALNRRVEIYITANEDMVKAAENGQLK